MLGVRARNLYSRLLANSKSFLLSSSVPKRIQLPSVYPSSCPEGNNIRNCLIPMRDMLASTPMEVMEDRVTDFLNAKDDCYGGVIVNVKEPMDSMFFSSLLEMSMSSWRKQGKKGIWIKLPIGHANLIEATVKAGFRYHHAEADYLMLVRWIPNTVDTLPANASHVVGIGAFVVNDNREILVVQERYGWFKDTGIWKLPTGTVEEGEDFSTAAVREVKEETGIDTEFVEVLAFRQSHKSFFGKSNIFIVCMLQPRSADIQTQASEIAAAQWMPIEDYVAQPIMKQNSDFSSVAKICLEKLDGSYNGFTPLPTNKQHTAHLFASTGHQP